VPPPDDRRLGRRGRAAVGRRAPYHRQHAVAAAAGAGEREAQAELLVGAARGRGAGGAPHPGAERGVRGGGAEEVAPGAPPRAQQPPAVAPRRQLGAGRAAHAHELHPAGELRERHVRRAVAARRRAEQALARLERLPALLHRREVPPPAGEAHGPEPPARHVERDAPADRERLDRRVPAEGREAVIAGAVHGGAHP
jgi:hypothetical protein